jgi:hypothetical protein
MPPPLPRSAPVSRWLAGVTHYVLLAAVVSTANVIGACSREPTEALDQRPTLDQAALNQGGTEQIQSEFPAVPRVALEVTAGGPFLPNRPIPLAGKARARFDAADVRYRLFIMDDDPAAMRGAELKSPQLLGQWQGGLASAQERFVHATLTFPRPGYYRVTATATNQQGPNATRWQADSLILDDVTANLWILVDERGGRLTDGYDSTAVPPGVIPLYGSYGPFVPRPRTIRSATQPRSLGYTAGGRDWLASLKPGDVHRQWDRGTPKPVLIHASYQPQAPGAAVDGVFSYWNHDFSPAVLDPVPGAEVEAICWGKSEPFVIVYDIFESVYTTTTPWGGFHVGCSPGYEYVEG